MAFGTGNSGPDLTRTQLDREKSDSSGKFLGLGSTLNPIQIYWVRVSGSNLLPERVIQIPDLIFKFNFTEIVHAIVYI